MNKSFVGMKMNKVNTQASKLAKGSACLQRKKENERKNCLSMHEIFHYIQALRYSIYLYS